MWIYANQFLIFLHEFMISLVGVENIYLLTDGILTLYSFFVYIIQRKKKKKLHILNLYVILGIIIQITKKMSWIIIIPYNKFPGKNQSVTSYHIETKNKFHVTPQLKNKKKKQKKKFVQIHQMFHPVNSGYG